MTRVAPLVLGLLALTSCRQLLGLHDLESDAPVPAGSDALVSDGDRSTDALVGGSDGTVTADDLDGDGVPDASDNCPHVANADQHDFDQDGFGDVCDNCPPTANANQGDADADGVGDACDPQPTISGDKLALFDGFYVDDVTTGAHPWSIAGGTWSVSNHQLHQTDITTTLGAINSPASYARAAVVTVAHVDAIGSAAVSGIFVGTFAGVGSGASDRTEACLLLEFSPTGTPNVIAYADNPVAENQATWTDGLVAGGQYTITQRIDTADHCTVQEGSAAKAASLTATANPGSVGLGAAHMTASFDYVLVIDESGEVASLGSGSG